MFVFKAAVVGTGAAGAESPRHRGRRHSRAAQGRPRDARRFGLAQAREASEKAAAKLVAKGKLSEEAARAQVDRIAGLIIPTASYAGFGDVDFVIEAVSDRSSQAPRLLRARRGDAGPRDPRVQHLRAFGHRDRRDHAAAGPGRRLPPGRGESSSRSSRATTPRPRPFRPPRRSRRGSARPRALCGAPRVRRSTVIVASVAEEPDEERARGRRSSRAAWCSRRPSRGFATSTRG